MATSEDFAAHFEHPQNVGVLDKTSPRVGTGVAGEPQCGDVIKMQIEVDESGSIVEARFKTFGCGAAIAASSFTTVWLKGRTLAQARGMKAATIIEALDLQPEKTHCAELAEEAVGAALDDYTQKQAIAGR